ncbi:hypothetical protein AGDE_13425 [Angomonas deanei]|uniref:META domain containing protein, putative n=1 Tax=Angomonas deanei TaxID=59799 RepID=A0A7G2C9Y6_9TRYP|nr:hypothetical protein AGDE_13425 [Angomonas deanei]CAD2216265.1 META domain containing protein, putative [Angomonas deanei]|eukprot:EPY22356.1 hypothetical protein AGDE_13425 [Angomonas deanei]
MVSISDLTGKYSLTAFGGETLPAPVVVELTADGEKLKFHAQVANSMNGSLTLADGKLKGMLMSTRMMGPPALMKVEGFFGKFMEGIEVKKDGSNIVLTAGSESAVLAHM